MSRTYEDVTTARRAKLGHGQESCAEGFEQSYRIAMQIVELREFRGLTRWQLAERCGIAQADIRAIERGSSRHATRALQRIADALDADLKLVPRDS